MAAALPPEARQHRGDAMQRAAEIDVDHRVPIRDPERVEARDRADAGIVHQHIHPAETRHRQRDQRLQLGQAGDIGRPPGGAAARGRDLFRQRRQRRLAPPAQHQGAALRGQQQRAGPADAAARAGDDDGLLHGDAPPAMGNSYSPGAG
ncbi:hypothetical protein QE401_002141 [Pseudoroseomonas cervicalis]|nr:hypothetical protein [Pseudoroseomonas cervicalis]